MKIENPLRIGIIGGGISGVYAALWIKELHPEYDVEIIDHNDKLNKKIYATGNGKCNFANSSSLEDKYTNEDFALPILKEHTYKDIVNYFNKIGIPSVFEDNNAYPMSKCASTVGMMMEKRVKELGIKVKLSTKVKDIKTIYKGLKYVATDKGVISYDKLVIALGGKSSSQLGSDGSGLDILEKHKYSVTELNPMLCPVKTKENTKFVDGVRSQVVLSTFSGNKLLHQEEGELLFKDKGISGIVVFNSTFYINNANKKDISYKVDFVPLVKEKIGYKDYDKYVNPKLAEYLSRNKQDIHNTVFSFKDFYDYSVAHVTHGGLSVSEVTNNLESKKNPDVFFIGEILDVDGICGGYNMMWAFASAYKVARSI